MGEAGVKPTLHSRGVTSFLLRSIKNFINKCRNNRPVPVCPLYSGFTAVLGVNLEQGQYEQDVEIPKHLTLHASWMYKS